MTKSMSGSASLGVICAAISGVSAIVSLLVVLFGPARWIGGVEARMHNVEQAAVRIESKVDQILLQRRETNGH